MQDTLGRKADALDQVLTDGDNQVAVLSRSNRQEQAELLYGVVGERIRLLDAAARAGRRSARAVLVSGCGALHVTQVGE